MAIVQFNAHLPAQDTVDIFTGTSVDLGAIGNEVAQDVERDPITYLKDPNLAERNFQRRLEEQTQRSFTRDSLRFSVRFERSDFAAIRQTIASDLARGDTKRFDAILERGTPQTAAIIIGGEDPIKVGQYLADHLSDRRIVDILQAMPKSGEAASYLMRVLERVTPNRSKAIRGFVDKGNRAGPTENTEQRHARILFESLTAIEALKKRGGSATQIDLFLASVDTAEREMIAKRKSDPSTPITRNIQVEDPPCDIEFNATGTLNGLACEEVEDTPEYAEFAISEAPKADNDKELPGIGTECDNSLPSTDTVEEDPSLPAANDGLDRDETDPVGDSTEESIEVSPEEPFGYETDGTGDWDGDDNFEQLSQQELDAIMKEIMKPVDFAGAGMAPDVSIQAGAINFISKSIPSTDETNKIDIKSWLTIMPCTITSD